MHKVFAYGMSPKTIRSDPVPWVMLKEKVVFSVMVDRTVRIVVPTLSLAEMKLGPEVLII